MASSGKADARLVRGSVFVWAVSVVMVMAILAAEFHEEVLGSDAVFLGSSAWGIAILLAPSLMLLVILRAPHWLKLVGLGLQCAAALLLAWDFWVILGYELGWL